LLIICILFCLISFQHSNCHFAAFDLLDAGTAVDAPLSAWRRLVVSPVAVDDSSAAQSVIAGASVLAVDTARTAIQLYVHECNSHSLLNRIHILNARFVTFQLRGGRRQADCRADGRCIGTGSFVFAVFFIVS
jgi:hypothetical protein